MTRVFCALDRNIYAPINGDRHRVRFSLDRTLADGTKAEAAVESESNETVPKVNSSNETKLDVEANHELGDRKESGVCEFKFLKIN